MAKKKPTTFGVPWEGGGVHPDSIPAEAGLSALPSRKRPERKSAVTGELAEQIASLWENGAPASNDAFDQLLGNSMTRMAENADALLAAKRAERQAKLGGQEGRLLSYMQKPASSSKRERDPSIHGKELPADLDDEYWDEELEPEWDE